MRVEAPSIGAHVEQVSDANNVPQRQHTPVSVDIKERAMSVAARVFGGGVSAKSNRSRSRRPSGMSVLSVFEGENSIFETTHHASSHAATTRRSVTSGAGAEPHATLIRQICKDLYTRFMEVARTMDADTVKDVGVQVRTRSKKTKKIMLSNALHLPFQLVVAVESRKKATPPAAPVEAVSDEKDEPQSVDQLGPPLGPPLVPRTAPPSAVRRPASPSARKRRRPGLITSHNGASPSSRVGTVRAVTPRPPANTNPVRKTNVVARSGKNGELPPMQPTNNFDVVGTEDRNIYSLLFRPPDDDGMYDVFLRFVDPAFCTEDMRANYLSFKRSDGNVPLQLFVSILCGVYTGTRIWMSDYTTSPTALAAMAVTIPSTMCFFTLLTMRMTMLSYAFNIGFLQRYYEDVAMFLESRWGQFFDNSFILCASLAMGLHLLAVALAAACPPGTSVFYQNGCNPLRGSAAIPAEAMVMPMAFVLVNQTIARGCSNAVLCVAWVIGIVSVNMSMVLTGNMDYLWINMELVILLCLSYELERMPLRQFIK